ncbi:MAG: YbaK/EbsC family protein [Gordonia sp. (in: high G+C Gram-positive bacteria)]|jgi:prolyl-tRNA editing enzyme YbaK/EbsC (Cys-tRNA(Pro) deacylase)|nr:YbaK/EbsC family protein [Gordonia sp. (in: high G+C Gram-positive bacteria)]
MAPRDPALVKVENAFAAAGLHGRLAELPTDVPTAAAAAEYLGCGVGAICNSVIFRVGDEPVLVLCSGANRVDEAKAAARFGVPKLSRADPEFVHAATGQRVGGCAPVGHPAPIRTLVDASLAEYEFVWAGGGVANAVFRVTHDELVILTGAPSVDIRAGTGSS